MVEQVSLIPIQNQTMVSVPPPRNQTRRLLKQVQGFRNHTQEVQRSSRHLQMDRVNRDRTTLDPSTITQQTQTGSKQ